MSRKIKVSEIEVKSNLKFVTDKLEGLVAQCEQEGYTSRVSEAFKLIVNFGLSNCQFWFDEIKNGGDKKEIEGVVLTGHIFLIRLNNIAQKHLNGIDMPSIAEQLNNHSEIKKFFNDVIFE